MANMSAIMFSRAGIFCDRLTASFADIDSVSWNSSVSSLPDPAVPIFTVPFPSLCSSPAYAISSSILILAADLRKLDHGNLCTKSPKCEGALQGYALNID